MSLSEYIVLFVLVTIMGAGVPGPGDASLIAAGTLAGGLSYFLGAEIARRIGNAGTRVVLGVLVIVAIGLAIRAGLSRWRVTQRLRKAG